jgi:hypothetical protein
VRTKQAGLLGLGRVQSTYARVHVAQRIVSNAVTYIATSDVPLSYVFLPVVRKSETAAEAEGCMLAEVLAPRPFELHFENLRIEKMMMWGTFGMW